MSRSRRDRGRCPSRRPPARVSVFVGGAGILAVRRRVGAPGRRSPGPPAGPWRPFTKEAAARRPFPPVSRDVPASARAQQQQAPSVRTCTPSTLAVASAHRSGATRTASSRTGGRSWGHRYPYERCSPTDQSASSSLDPRGAKTPKHSTSLPVGPVTRPLAPDGSAGSPPSGEGGTRCSSSPGQASSLPSPARARDRPGTG